MDSYARTDTRRQKHQVETEANKNTKYMEKEGKVKTKAAPVGYLLCAKDCAALPLVASLNPPHKLA